MKTPGASDALLLLQSLAASQAETAAKQLAAARKREADAQSRLGMLDQMQRDYLSRMSSALSAGTGMAQWQNFNQFMAKVERAVDGQTRIVSDASASSQRAQQAWQQQKLRQQSFETLIQRAALLEARRQQKREQKAMDEFAANAARQLAGSF